VTSKNPHNEKMRDRAGVIIIVKADSRNSSRYQKAWLHAPPHHTTHGSVQYIVLDYQADNYSFADREFQSIRCNKERFTNTRGGRHLFKVDRHSLLTSYASGQVQRVEKKTIQAHRHAVADVCSKVNTALQNLVCCIKNFGP